MQYIYEFTLSYDRYSVTGVTQLHEVVYIVGDLSSRILRYNSTTHQRLTDIIIKDLRVPWDIVACQQTSQMYVTDNGMCIWRVSADGEDIKYWLPKSPSDLFTPWKLSVTSTRLLVTSDDTHQLAQFDADGNELRCVQLPDDMQLRHAVESPAGTFIVSQYNKQLEQGRVSEVNIKGEVLRQFSRSRLLSLSYIPHIAVDSHGNILVADRDNCRILLLDKHLSLRRFIIDKRPLYYSQPRRLCYVEQSGQLLVGMYNVNQVAVFDVLRR